MNSLASYIINNYRGKVVEIGIGEYGEVASALSRNEDIEFIAVDKKNREYTDFEFYVDDLSSPDIEIYRGAELLYSIRPPMDILESIIDLKKQIGCDLLIVPLHDDIPSQSYELINHEGEVIYKF